MKVPPVECNFYQELRRSMVLILISTIILKSQATIHIIQDKNSQDMASSIYLLTEVYIKHRFSEINGSL